MARFGPVVEHAPFDWRKTMDRCGEDVAVRCRSLLAEAPEAKIVLVSHSMGGLAAAAALRSNPDLRASVAGVLGLGVPWLGSFEAFLNLKGEGDRVRQFVKLTGRTTGEALEVLQTFWGLVHLMPEKRTDLLDPTLYTPGPMSHLPADADLFQSIAKVARSVPHGTPLLNVGCDRKSTVVNVQLGAGGIERVHGPGDGTVPIGSALAGGTLPAILVDEPHMTIPLDRQAIRTVSDQIAAWTGLGAGGRVPGGPGAERLVMEEMPDVEELLTALDEPLGFRLSDLRSLMPLL
jgi:pimeloyl-ACP methyl ester carboxylesterase